ncbi:hypothetical protein MNBD_BACTEROID06-1440 [hydrothermal vent metagenome]|uniref:Uncharacterized protein n=1 Tax=hydrothermal vent metagenome TaxID=652676 RepID=A0A3B0VBB1_9ZZZZ
MSKVQNLFKKLTTYHHFLVFLSILTILKIVNVFIISGINEGLHFTKLGVGLLVISSLLHLIFRTLFDKKKKYLHSLISTFLIILMLSHADPEPVRGVLVILLLYIAKFFVKYKGKNIFNPVVFTIGVITLLALFVPFLDVPPMDFTGIDIRFPIVGLAVPLSLLPITLALLFNVARVKRHPLAISYIVISLLLGFFINAYSQDVFSYLIIIMFVGAAVIIEPKTSPVKTKEQLIYGSLMAFFIAGLAVLNIPNAIAVGLLAGNVGYFIYNNRLIKPPA